jgi:hypothetical protein
VLTFPADAPAALARRKRGFGFPGLAFESLLLAAFECSLVGRDSDFSLAEKGHLAIEFHVAESYSEMRSPSVMIQLRPASYAPTLMAPFDVSATGIVELPGVEVVADEPAAD